MHYYEDFPSEKSLNHHIDRKHFNIKENTKKNLCTVCEIKFNRNQSYMHHVETVHSTKVEIKGKDTSQEVKPDRSKIEVKASKERNTYGGRNL